MGVSMDVKKSRLKKLRDQISFIDEKIVSLLEERFSKTLLVGIYKKENNIEIENKEVENIKINNILEKDDLIYSIEIASIFKEIFRLSKKQQENLM